MTDTASKDVVHVLRNMWKMFLGFHRAATYESRNTVDGDISGHTSVFTFFGVCFVFCSVSRVHRTRTTDER